MTGLLPAMRPLEHRIVATMLGIRFWDGARGVPVTNGLLVRARLPSAPARFTCASPTRSGVYAFHHLPGLRALEYPTSDPFAASPPETQRFVIDVVDPVGRYVPAALGVDAPTRGIFPTDGAISPPGDAVPGFVLFPAVTSVAPGSMAVVRAELFDRTLDVPAAHAVLEISMPGGRREYGLADAQGRVAAMFPHPRFAPTVLSPPPSPDDAREPVSWAVSIRVLYDRAGQVAAAPGLPPDLGSLFRQPASQVWASDPGPAATDLGVTLVLGQETVLRTDDGPRLLVG